MGGVDQTTEHYMGLRPTNVHESPQAVIPSAARNLLVQFCSQKQIPRRFAPRNDKAGG